MNDDTISRREAIEAFQPYKEYESNVYEQGEGKVWQAGEGLMMLFAELGQLRELAPDAEKVQEKVVAIQKFITDHFYTCTKEIFRGLGEMYVGDERMKCNIDKVGGEGTAAFARRAIQIYCDK